VASPRTAGYAAVVSVGADLVNDLLAAAAASVTMPSFSLGPVQVDGDQVVAAGSLSLLAPTVAFSPNPANLVDVTFGCSGTLQLTSNGDSLIEVTVGLQSTAAVDLFATATATSLGVGLLPGSVVLESISVEVAFGPNPLPAVYQSALADPTVLSTFTEAVRAVPTQAATFTLPGVSGSFSLGYGGYDLDLSITQIAVIPVAGNALTVAIDVAPYTSGSASELVNLIATDSPTPLYFSYDAAGDLPSVEGGIFGAHVNVGPADGYAPSYGTNLAVAVNADFLCSVVNGPLAAQVGGMWLDLPQFDLDAITPQHTVGHSDTLASIAASLSGQLNGYPFFAQRGLSTTVAGPVITIAGPVSFLPQTLTDTTSPVSATEILTVGGNAPDVTVTISGQPSARDVVTLTIVAQPGASSQSASYMVVHGDTLDSIAAGLCQAAQGAVPADISVSASGSVIRFTRPASASSLQVSSATSRQPTEHIAISGTTPNNTLTVVGTLTPGDIVGFTLSVPGTRLTSISLDVQEVENSNPAYSSPGLPTLVYPCMTLTVNADVVNLTAFTLTVSMCPILNSKWGYWEFVGVEWAIEATLLSIVDDLFPLGPVIFAGAINGAVAALVANALYQYEERSLNLSGHQAFPGAPGWSISYDVLGLVVSPAQPGDAPDFGDLDSYASVGVSGPSSVVPSAPTFGLSTDDNQSLVSLAPIPVQLGITNGASLLDPALGLRISWTATRDDYGTAVDIIPGVTDWDVPLTTAATKIEIQRADAPTGDLIYNDTWTVTCRVYLPGDNLVNEYTYWQGQIAVGLTDVVDRHHPYVYWLRAVWFSPGESTMRGPVGPKGKGLEFGFSEGPHGPEPEQVAWSRLPRTSRIHRTDLLTRCRDLVPALSTVTQPRMQYLDGLAEGTELIGSHKLIGAHDQIDHWRHGVLCDYCFFGSPTSTQWKTPTPPTPVYPT